MSAPVRSVADRNLLFAVLALQMDFISRDALIQGLNAWVLDKTKPLGQILVERGSLSSDLRLMLEPLVDKHLELHGGDMEQSLAAVRGLQPVRLEAGEITDPDVEASLTGVPADVPATVTNSPGLVPRVSDSSTQSPQLAFSDSTGPGGSRFSGPRFHAEGGLGVVFIALDQQLQREVALKEIKNEWAHHSPSRARFVLEATITGGLEHPGIVPVYALGAYPDGRPYYAMRLIRGESLQEALRRFHAADHEKRDPGERTLELRKLLDRFVDMCNALAYAHSRGVLHRDLKPANVMLGPYGETLVVDWGLAKTVGRSESSQHLSETTLRPNLAGGFAQSQGTLGTPAYMSPEQAAGELDQLGPASDVYSLGATLYHLLTGQSPFKGSDIQATLSLVRRGEFPRPREVKETVSPALEAICLKAMALKPGDRYATARDLADEVERWLADEPVEAYADSLPERTARWTRRHRGATLAGAAALLLVAVVSVCAAVLVNQQRRVADSRLQLAVANTARITELADSSGSLGTGDATVLEEVLTKNHENLTRLVEETHDEVQSEKLRADLVKNLVALAKFRRSVGNSSGSAEAAGKAVEVAEALSKAYPTQLSYRARLADSLQELAAVTNVRGRSSEARQYCERAQSIYQEIVALDPQSLELQGKLARNQRYVGDMLYIQGYWQQSRSAYENAAKIGQQLVAARPENGDWRSDLVLSSVKVGIATAALGEELDWASRLNEAIRVHEELLRGRPNNSDWKVILADLRWYYGDSLLNTGRIDEASQQFMAVREIAVPQSLADPRNAEWMRLRMLVEFNLFDLDSPGNKPSPEQQLEVVTGFVEMCRQRVAEDAGDTTWKARLAFVQRVLGQTLVRYFNDDKHRSAAKQALEGALSIDQELAALDPERFNLTYLSNDHMAMGQYFVATGQQKLANREFQSSAQVFVDFYERRTKQHPEDLYWRSSLANARSQLAWAYLQGSLIPEPEAIAGAIENFQASVELLDALVKAQPENNHWRKALADGQYNLAPLVGNQGKIDEGIAHTEAALKDYRELNRTDPAGATRLTDLNKTYNQLMLWFRMSNRPGDAILEEWRRVRARLHAARLKLVLEPPLYSAWRRSTIIRPQYYEERLARQRYILRNEIGLFKHDQGPLVDVAEQAVEMAIEIAEALQWAEGAGSVQFAAQEEELGKLLQMALDAYRSAFGEDVAAEETALIAALEDAIRRMAAKTEADSAWRDQAAKTSQLLSPARAQLGEIQQNSPWFERGRAVAAALDTFAAGVAVEPIKAGDFELLASKSDHTFGAIAIAATLDGRKLATASTDATIRIRDTKSAETTVKFADLEGMVTCLEFSPDGALLAAGVNDGHLLIWELDKQSRRVRAKLFNSSVNKISFSKDGKLLAVAAPDEKPPGVVRLWNVAENRELPPIEGLGAPVYGVWFLSVSPPMLATVGMTDGAPTAEIRVLDCENWAVGRAQKLELGKYPQYFTLSSDGTMLACGNRASPAAIWNVNSGELLHSLLLDEKPEDVACLVFAPGNGQLALGDMLGKVTVWDTDSGKLLRTTTAGDGGAHVVFLGDGSSLATAREDVLPPLRPENLSIWRTTAR